MPAIMIQGCGSDVGKSVLVAGLCRLFANRGRVVRPFKSQNMSNNAAVTVDGGEIGRAQALQALACRVDPSVHMNPVLLKPETDLGAQLIVRGRRAGTLHARAHLEDKRDLLRVAVESYRLLEREADWMIIEGAGSPAETNLRAHDIANMGFAAAVNVPVVLVGDIDRGHVIASLVGAHTVLSAEDRARIRGFIINKFRGDQSLFAEGTRTVVSHTGWQALGIVPWLHAAVRLPSEDGVRLERIERGGPSAVARAAGSEAGAGKASSHIAGTAELEVDAGKTSSHVARAAELEADAGKASSHIAGTAELEADAGKTSSHVARVAELEADAGKASSHITRAAELASGADEAISPVARALKLEGRAHDATLLSRTRSVKIVVPCLSRISNFDDFDPLRAEPYVDLVFIPPGRPLPADAALIILPGTKSTIAELAFFRAQGWDIDLLAHVRRGGRVLGVCGGFQMLGRWIHDPQGIEGIPGSAPGLALLDVETTMTPEKTLRTISGTTSDGARFKGYEIHIGSTTGPAMQRPMLRFDDGRADGARSENNLVSGCYVHSLFNDVDSRRELLASLDIQSNALDHSLEVDRALDEIAAVLARCLDIDALETIACESVARSSG